MLFNFSVDNILAILKHEFNIFFYFLIQFLTRFISKYLNKNIYSLMFHYQLHISQKKFLKILFFSFPRFYEMAKFSSTVFGANSIKSISVKSRH